VTSELVSNRIRNGAVIPPTQREARSQGATSAKLTVTGRAPVAPAPSDGAPRSPGVHAALSVVEALVVDGPASLVELSRRLGLPKSTLHRICAILAERGWVVRDDHGRYEPGVRAIGLGSRASDLPIVTGFRHAVSDLVSRHDETVGLAVVDGVESVYLAIEETSQPVRLATWVGRRTPAFASASGRAILAAHPREAIVRDYGGRPLITPTGRRLRSVAELHEILAAVRRDGYAENWEETAHGLYTASVPITNDGGAVLAAVTICIPTSRVTEPRRAEILVDLVAAGRSLSGDVAWLPAFDARRH
jgi:IclR family KDG regulon transcriptional repressor